MAAFPLTDAVITLGGSALSPHVTSLNLEPSADAPESTAFGDEWRTRVGGGLKDSSISMDVNMDFATGAIDAIMWPLLGTLVAFAARATSLSTRSS